MKNNVACPWCGSPMQYIEEIDGYTEPSYYECFDCGCVITVDTIEVNHEDIINNTNNVDSSGRYSNVL